MAEEQSIPDKNNVGMDIGSTRLKATSDHKFKEIEGGKLEKDGKRLIIVTASAENTDPFALRRVGKRIFHGDDATRLLGFEDSPKEDERLDLDTGFEGGYLLKEGLIDPKQKRRFGNFMYHVMNSIPGGELYIVGTVPPEEIINQQIQGRLKAKTSNIKILDEAVGDYDRIAVVGKKGQRAFIRIAQPIAASYSDECRDEIYREGPGKESKRVVFADWGGGTIDLMALNVEPGRPFRVRPKAWIGIKNEDDVNIAGNFRDEYAKDLIESKIEYGLGIKKIREIMAQYSFVDEKGFDELRKLKVTGGDGRDDYIDIFDEVKKASMVIPQMFPYALQKLAGRFTTQGIREELLQNVYLTGQAATTKGLKGKLEELISDLCDVKNVNVTILKNSLYAAAEGSLVLSKWITEENAWEEVVEQKAS